jgi:hypothetical protein
VKPFIRTKVIKGNEYLYEITPFLDPDSGKWKQKTRYLGKNVNGEPVRRDKPGKPGQIFDLGQYIPAYWAVREYQISEVLLSGCSPEETNTLILLAINRLIAPCPPANLQSWMSGTYLSRLFPGALSDPDEIRHLLESVSDRPVAEIFTQMFSLINKLSDKRVLMIIQNCNAHRAGGTNECSLYADFLRHEIVLRILYDPVTKIPAGCEFFSFQRVVLDNSIQQISSGRIPGGVIVPYWDYMTPSLINQLIKSGCPFIIRPDIRYGPVSSFISSWGVQTYHPANIRYYHGQTCYIRSFNPVIDGVPIKGYILHDIRKEQSDRVTFHKNLQNIRDYISESLYEKGIFYEGLTNAAGPYEDFFKVEETGGASIRKDEVAISAAMNRFGRSGVLYTGDYSWEECFNLVDTRVELEREISRCIGLFESDYQTLRIDRIRKGMYFVAFLTTLIRQLIINRLDTARIPNVSTFEALITELTPIHVVKSYKPVIVPERLQREHKTILSFFGGLPQISG